MYSHFFKRTHQQFIRKILFHEFWSVSVLTKFNIRFLILYMRRDITNKNEINTVLGQNRETYPSGKIG